MNNRACAAVVGVSGHGFQPCRKVWTFAGAALECGVKPPPSHNRREAFLEGVVKVEGKSIESGALHDSTSRGTSRRRQAAALQGGLRPQKMSKLQGAHLRSAQARVKPPPATVRRNSLGLIPEGAHPRVGARQ
jgi:hypothetical protein